MKKASVKHSKHLSLCYVASQEDTGGSPEFRSVNTFYFSFSLAQTSTWAMPHLNRKQPSAKRAVISPLVKTGHILFCVQLTLSSPQLCWNLYWCCLKGLELIHCFFLTAVLNRAPLPQYTLSYSSWAVDNIHTGTGVSWCGWTVFQPHTVLNLGVK